MTRPAEFARFEQVILPHMDAAYNLARWLMRDAHAAEDAVQEAFLRAYEGFAQFRGVESRAWVLTIVRNTCLSQLQRNRRLARNRSLDDNAAEPESDEPDPQSMLMQKAAVESVRDGIASLPLNLREIIVLREIEGMSYSQIGSVLGIPMGTVMSRLSRARERLAQILSLREGAASEL